MASSAFQKTLDYLNAAFLGESNAANRYQEFAKKADAEGYAYAARLFRAAARAEKIHQEGHKKAILSLGGGVAEPVLPEVKAGATAENLALAVAGEVQERDVLYPKFLAVAKEDGATEAIRAMTYALNAETEHAALFLDAIYNLGNNVDLPLFVCPVCGHTATTVPENQCQNCLTPAKQFERID